MVITDTSEVSLIRLIRVLLIDGTAIFSACGSTTWRSACGQLRPRLNAARHCPCPIPRMAPRRLSDR
jgi:hypothetical protein